MVTMEELLASQTTKIITPHRGQQVEGVVVSITDKEITLDIGAKSEGILLKRELSDTQTKDLKLGYMLQAYVIQTENESGQIVLSTFAQSRTGNLSSDRRGVRSYGINWQRFSQAQNQKSKLQGKVAEVNKGGLIVEVEGSPREAGTRGFLPNSQVGFELLSKAGKGMEDLIGQDLTITVSEVDSANNKLIFSQRGQVSDELKEKLNVFKNGQKVKGKIVAILPFGLVVDVLGVEGLVFISDVAWEKIEDLQNKFRTGQEMEVVVIGSDQELGRLNLSIKQLSRDPFSKLTEVYPADEIVKGEVTGVSEAGVSVKLADGVEGLLSASKMDPDTSYKVGKNATFLVDGIDSKRRRINLAPFVTSTAGLIYK